MMPEQGRRHAPATRTLGRLHVLTDVVLQRRWSHVDLAVRAARGGADVVQYRDKRSLRAEERLDTLRALRAALPAAVALVVDDHPELVEGAGADGVHVGAGDPEPARARQIVGPHRWVGATANDLATAQRLSREPVDYLGVGPVFGTTSKANPAPPLGVEGLARIVREVSVPVIAIGGITPENAPRVLEAGAYGIAVLSGVATAADPEAAARDYADVLAHGFGTRSARS